MKGFIKSHRPNNATTWKFSLDTAGQKLPVQGFNRDQTKD